ncbi:hypothetical protein OAE79_01425 [Rhodopirellula sp.]|nr:hypothetical protein [Rhodopirellula sp.]
MFPQKFAGQSIRTPHLRYRLMISIEVLCMQITSVEVNTGTPKLIANKS